jgi:hypothetical protein
LDAGDGRNLLLISTIILKGMHFTHATCIGDACQDITTDDVGDFVR